MRRVLEHRRFWGFHVSARVYRHTYLQIAHQLDDDLFTYLGDRITDATIADCGCGPGVVTAKLVDRGAARVYAIDLSASMLGQLRARVPEAIAAGRVVPIQRTLNATLFDELHAQIGATLDLVLFKRSLYAPPPEALQSLRAAIRCLRPRGMLVVIHGERSTLRHALGPRLRPARYTAYHLFNRIVSRLGARLGVGDYTLYTQRELVDLLTRAADGRPVEIIPSDQRAYNLAAIRLPD